MGNCSSFESESVLTAKLIQADGHLKEFSWPVKISLLLPQQSDVFICSAEEMDFGEFAVAMGGDEVLQPGELYFELPSGWRNQRLQAEDMAVLAAKANVALANNTRDDHNGRIFSCCCCVSTKVDRVSLFPEKERLLLAAEGGGACAKTGQGSGGGGGAKGGKFVARLSAIVED